MSSTRSTSGVLRARSAVASCFASRTTIASAAGRSTESPCSKISAWLGFEPDVGFEPLLRQSDTPGSTSRLLDRLARIDSRLCVRMLAQGHRRRTLRRALSRSRTRARVRCAEFVCNLADGDEVFDDALLGRQTQTPAEQCGDLLVRDRDGHWTYQFAVTVDDLRQDVTLVIRGRISCRQPGVRFCWRGCWDAEMLRFSCIIRSSMTVGGEKLSKSAGDTGVRELRSAGLTAT